MPNSINTHAILALRNMYKTAVEACMTVGDMDPATAACLAFVVEQEQETPLAHIRNGFSAFHEPMHYIQTLEEGEFALRRRDARDRRRFVLQPTKKGIARSQLIENALATLLVEHFRRLTESAFERLIKQLHIVFGEIEYTLFPSGALRALCLAQHILTVECARLGVTSLQAATLCLMSDKDSDRMFSCDDLANALGVERTIMQNQLDSLEERQLIHNNDALILLPSGYDRARRVSIQSAARLHEEVRLGIVAAHRQQAFDELCEYCIRLFR